jgi:hypothetical protein
MRSEINTQKFNERLGIYHVNNQKYHNAFDALKEAKKQNTNIRWDFNDSTFSQIKWNEPINISLDELYRMRLFQLRNEYDHLILFFSGGRDSMNILNTAIKNKILIDEIVMFYPFEFAKHFNKNDVSADNNFSEIEYSAKPFLQKNLNDLDPRTKIRYIDLAHDNIKMFLNDDWIEKVPPNQAISLANRTTSVFFDPGVVDLAMRGKHVALIYGVDKPRIAYNGGNYYATFIDMPFFSASRPNIKDKSEMFDKFIFYEAFYWTPYLPELAVKQAQVALAGINSNSEYKILFRKDNTYELAQLKEKILCDFIYSDRENPWQTRKPDARLDKKINQWFSYLAPEKARINLIEGIKSVIPLYDMNHFIDGKITKGKKVSRSKPYYLGRET